MKKAVAEGVKFIDLPESEKARAKATIQPAQVESWINKVAQPNGIDGKAMQDVIEKAIAKHASEGKLKRPIEIAASL